MDYCCKHTGIPTGASCLIVTEGLWSVVVIIQCNFCAGILSYWDVCVYSLKIFIISKSAVWGLSCRRRLWLTSQNFQNISIDCVGGFTYAGGGCGWPIKIFKILSSTILILVDASCGELLRAHYSSIFTYYRFSLLWGGFILNGIILL